MIPQLENPQIRKILSLDGSDEPWREALERMSAGAPMSRASVGEDAIKSFQRLLIFLGYSTSTSGSFSIDGDFGRGTNRGVAQFQFEHNINPRANRATLCYKTTFQTAKKDIVAIPDVNVDMPTLRAMLEVAEADIKHNRVTFGEFDRAIFHLNEVHRKGGLSSKEILNRYGAFVERAARDFGYNPEWILGIIKKETAGVVRPKFEQHKLSRFNEKNPQADLAELRIRSMSMGLGQIMGFNFEAVGAESASAMRWSPIEEQIVFMCRFLRRRRSILQKLNPSKEDFRRIARFYNGPKFEVNHYHEELERWFNEFKHLMRG